jgi:predicted nucleic acid-binding protein
MAPAGHTAASWVWQERARIKKSPSGGVVAGEMEPNHPVFKNPHGSRAVWALRKIFKFPRTKLVHFLNTVLETDVFILENREVVEAAMFGFSSGNADFADHVILESARRNGAGQVYTFDLDFSRIPGAVRLK